MTAGDMLLSVEDLVVRFRTHEGTIHAVNGVTFQLEEGERLGLVGESGCGKSVTNLAMIRLLPQPAGRIEGGHVMFDAQDLTTAAGGRAALDPWARHRDDLPGPDDEPQPRPDGRGADGRDDHGPPRDQPRQGHEPGRSSC